MIQQLSEVYSEGKISASNSSSSGIFAGGLIGYNNMSIKYSFSAVNLFIISQQNQFVGGLIGRNGAAISNSYSYGTVYSNINDNSNVNEVVGRNYTATLTSVYYNSDTIGLTKRSHSYSLVAKTAQQLLDTYILSTDVIWAKGDSTYPYLKNIDAPTITAGTLMSPIEIGGDVAFATIKDKSNYYIQTSNFSYNVNIKGTITNFAGVYIGSGYTIDYIQYANSGNVGLFYTISYGGMVASLGVNANITLTSGTSRSYNIGGLATINKGIIYKSYANTVINGGEQVSLTESFVGGLVFRNNLLIENSFANINFNAKIYGGDWDVLYAGGLVADSRSAESNPVINTSFAIGTIDIIVEEEITARVAGLAGSINNTELLNCYSAVNIKTRGGTAWLQGIASSVISSSILNTYHDRLLTNINDAYDKATPYMTTSAFIEDLQSNGRFSGIWKLNKTINYGYPYPYYLPSNYSANILKSGNGTFLEPYLINSVGRLDWIRTQLTSAAYFKQTRDIDLTSFNLLSLNTQFKPIGSPLWQVTPNTGTAISTPYIGIYEWRQLYNQ